MKNTDNSVGDKNPYNEELIKALQSEVELYKTEHELLRKEVYSVAKTNKELFSLLQNESKSGIPEDLLSHKTVSDQVVHNLKVQIQLLNEEKLTLENLWKSSQKTVLSLESEIKEYLRQFKEPVSIIDVKRAYSNAIRALEEKISNLQNEMKDVKADHMSLAKSKQLCEQKLIDLDRKHCELLAEHNELFEQVKRTEEHSKLKQNEIAIIHREKDRLEEKVAISISAQKTYRLREVVAYNKIQEALNIAETAISEKNEALAKEKEIREERDQLAITISQVMEEAGNRVENDVDGMRKKYNETILELKRNLLTANAKIKAHSRRSIELENCIKTLETKMNGSLKDNQHLDSDLQMASKTIIELEIKLQAYDRLMAKEHEITQNSEDQALLLRDFYDNNKKIKERWKHVFDEMSEKLQRELKKAQAENALLKMDNLKLKTALTQLDSHQTQTMKQTPN